MGPAPLPTCLPPACFPLAEAGGEGKLGWLLCPGGESPSTGLGGRRGEHGKLKEQMSCEAWSSLRGRSGSTHSFTDENPGPGEEAACPGINPQPPSRTLPPSSSCLLSTFPPSGSMITLCVPIFFFLFPSGLRVPGGRSYLLALCPFGACRLRFALVEFLSMGLGSGPVRVWQRVMSWILPTLQALPQMGTMPFLPSFVMCQ